jgi:hypothetical protein
MTKTAVDAVPCYFPGLDGLRFWLASAVAVCRACSDPAPRRTPGR